MMRAQVFQFAPIFTDHMVLQRDACNALFGIGTPGDVVTVCVPERAIRVETVVLPDGNWRAVLPPSGTGEAVSLTAQSGAEKLILHDVVYGEVWLAGGQSNMEFMLKDAKGGADELKACECSRVRCFQVPRNTYVDAAYEKAFEEAKWQTASPQTAGAWSAVAYLAAKELASELDVPVGIIGCNYGGSSVSCWIPESDLAAHKAGHPYLEDYRKATQGKTYAEMIAAYNAYLEYHAAWEKRMARCYQEDGDMPWDEVIRRCGENQWPGPMGIKSPYRPGGMYHTMLSRIVPYTIRGVFYYQGESDDHRPDTYGTLLTMMIARWRRAFLRDDLPFVLVQLPMFAYMDTPENGAWSKIREAQLRVSRTVQNVGLAVALDCGEFGNIHPVDKHAVGHRVALQAKCLVYGAAPCETSAPVYRRSYTLGDVLTVELDNASDGLEFHGTPEGFEIAGMDGVYHPAQVRIDGNRLHLTNPEVPVPAAARYAWVNYGAVTLYGKNGIPASPFRTTPFPMPLVSQMDMKSGEV